MMNFILLVALFLLVIWLGSIIMGVGRKRISHNLRGDLFAITYRGRFLYITGDRNIKFIKYSRIRNMEDIKIPIGKGKETAAQVESFLINSKQTSKLVKLLFNFDTLSPNGFLQYDFEYAKELIEIKEKLHTFCKKT